MAPQTIAIRVERLEARVTTLEELPARIEALTLQVSQLREEVRAEFSATRTEIRAGDEETRRVLRDEMHTEFGTLREEIRRHVGNVIGPIAKPDDVRFADALPKTRSGKIMRRLLKEIAAGNTVTGDTTTLEDLSVLAKLRTPED